MSSLRVVTAGLDLMAESVAAQGAAVTAVDWSPPAGGDGDALAALAATYGDPEVDAANRRALERLQSAQPHLVGAGRAGDLIPGLEGRMILHAGPPIEWERRCAPQRLAAAGACVLEGWADDLAGGLELLAAGEVTMAPAHSLGAAGAMTGIISPSVAAWHVRDEESGIEAWSPFTDGSGDAFWLGVGTPEAVGRQRRMTEVLAPAFAAALTANGPLDVFGLLAQGLAMGDDCHMRHQATTMLLMRELLPAMAEVVPESVAETARLVGANGHFALTITIAAARSALESIRGIGPASVVTFISRNGVEAAVQIAGLPDEWFPAPAPLVGDPLYRPGFGDEDAAGDIGDSALVECCGLGAAASAASPAVAAFLGGGLADAVAGTYEMDAICIGESERFGLPVLDGRGTPLGVDARAVVDLGYGPTVNTGILHKVDGGQIGAGIARVPVEPFVAALERLAASRAP